jgi:CMP-N,N'-diacetyllegionaminic acid synthase
LIPARGGSKGIPRKNIYNLAGKPLIAWTITSALKSKMIDEVIVSTDDKEISDISRKWGAKVPFKRPKSLASDKALRNNVITHALAKVKGYDVLIFLQPTSPLRNAKHIDESLTLFFETNSRACVSITKQHPTPHWIYKISNSKHLVKVFDQASSSNRQDEECFYKLNGAIYITKICDFKKSNDSDPFITDDTIGYEMDDLYSFDVDRPVDLKIVEKLIKEFEI